MSDELETMMRRAIKSGLLRFSLHENWINQKRAGGWAASYMHVESNMIFYVDDNDPIEAFKKAIKTGEAEVKRLREARRAQAPMNEAVKKIHRANKASIEEAEEDRERQRRKRQRDRDELI